MFMFVPAGLDVAAITKLVVETVRESDETNFTHHNQMLETGTTKVLLNLKTRLMYPKQKVAVTKIILIQQLHKDQLLNMLSGGPEED